MTMKSALRQLAWLVFVLVLATVQARSGLTQENRRTAERSRAAKEIEAYFDHLQSARYELIEERSLSPESAEQNYLGSQSQYFAKEMIKAKGSGVVEELEQAFTDPRNLWTLRILTEPKVRRELENRGFQHLELRAPVPVDLNPVPPVRDAAAKGAPKTDQDEIAQSGSRWSVSWGLEYKARDRSIPLWRSCQVKARLLGSELTVNLGSLPTLAQLPAGDDLIPNVGREDAVKVARDDFKARNKAAGYRFNDEDLVTVGTGEEVCQDETRAKQESGAAGPAGLAPYRLAWSVAVAVKPGRVAALTGIQYWIEAQVRDRLHPRILAISAPVLRAFGEQPPPAPANLPEGDNLIPNVEPEDATKIPNVEPEDALKVAMAEFRTRAAAGHKLNNEDLITLVPRSMLQRDVRHGINPPFRLTWAVIVTVRPVRQGAPAPMQYWVEARALDPQHPQIIESKVLQRFAGKVRGVTWPDDKSCKDNPNKWPSKPLNHFIVQFAKEGDAFETEREGDYVCFGGKDSKIPFLLEGPICRISGAPGDRVRFVIPKPRVVGDPNSPMDIELVTRNRDEAALTNAFYWINSGFDTHGTRLQEKQIKPEVPIQVFANLDGRAPEYQPPSAPGLSGTLFLPRDLSRVHPKFDTLNGSCPDIVLHEFGHAIDSLTPRVLTTGAMIYSDGFADAFAILCRTDQVVGRDLLGNGKHLRDYSQPNSRVVLDGKETEIPLTFERETFEKYFDAFQDQYCDDHIHFYGRVYAHFICDLIQRFQKRGLPKQQTFDRVATLVFRTDLANPADVLDAVQLMYGSAANDREQADIRQAALERRLWR